MRTARTLSEGMQLAGMHAATAVGTDNQRATCGVDGAWRGGGEGAAAVETRVSRHSSGESGDRGSPKLQYLANSISEILVYLVYSRTGLVHVVRSSK